MLLLLVNSLDSNNDFNNVPPRWKDRRGAKRASFCAAAWVLGGRGRLWSPSSESSLLPTSSDTLVSLLLGQCLVVTVCTG